MIHVSITNKCCFLRSTNCHEIGYAKRRRSNKSVSPDRDYTPSDKGKSSTISSSSWHLHIAKRPRSNMSVSPDKDYTPSYKGKSSAISSSSGHLHIGDRSVTNRKRDYISSDSGKLDSIDRHPHSRVN